MDTARACEVLGRIGTERGRVHPIGVLSAPLTCRSGRGVRGQHSWEPVSQVADALDAAFERSFAQAPQTGSRLYLGIDVSGSMGHDGVAGVPNLTPRMAAAVTADEKLSENAEMVLTHPIAGASFTKSSWRCSHFAEGGTSERDLRDERGGPFHQGDR